MSNRVDREASPMGSKKEPHAVEWRFDDPAAAAAVRSIARGNETVPTLVIGPVGMVNPSPREVVDAMREHTPDLLPEALR